MGRLTTRRNVIKIAGGALVALAGCSDTGGSGENGTMETDGGGGEAPNTPTAAATDAMTEDDTEPAMVTASDTEGETGTDTQTEFDENETGMPDGETDIPGNDTAGPGNATDLPSNETELPDNETGLPGNETDTAGNESGNETTANETGT
ncbi:cell wall anchor protein [Haloarcula sp. Atlit-120R]|uniref:cell wall anchor protein n=1 Tax=Haloarcula sp. Atlit-120R TaxID=2282135 RepID=UPI000EF17CA0|nr:cell wall anchor protein [Haloarcula sp. Atlit-120R]RLM36525.1 cell wall anchor protein [Haloarcula sp. Atlit-120R]